MKKLKLGIKDYILIFFFSSSVWNHTIKCQSLYTEISHSHWFDLYPKGALRLRLSVKQVSSACFSVTFLQYTVPMLKKEKYVNRRLSMVCTNFLFTGRISIVLLLLVDATSIMLYNMYPCYTYP